MRPINKKEAWSYFVGLFCKKNNIYLVKRTFEHLSKNPKGLMGHLKTQMCVRNAYKGEIIKEMELVYE